MTTARPPRIAAWLLARISRSSPGSPSPMLSDYEEIFENISRDLGVRAAKSWYWGQVLRSVPLFFVNHVFGSAHMIKNYLKLAGRSIMRHKRYAVLNILGLAVGLAACLLIAGYVMHELSFESAYSHKERVFRINGRIPMAGRTLLNGVVAAPFGPAAEATIPEVEESVRILRRRNVPIEIGQQAFREDKLFFAEQTMLDVFEIPLIRGDRGSALEAPFSVVLDEALAHKYFGEQDPLGRTLRLTLASTFEFQVTGIMKPMPSNTVLRVPMLVSFSTLQKPYGDQLERWVAWGNITTFVKLAKGADPEGVSDKLTSLALSHLSDQEQDASFFLQPLARIYLERESLHMNNDLDGSGSRSRIYVFAVIALLIMTVAAINFINLSTAKIAGRLKEVGIRKTCGAERVHLIKQFLMESLLLTTIAMGFGLALFALFKPRLDAYLGKTLDLAFLSSPLTLLIMAALVVSVGILAGSYPAFFLSRFPAAVIFRSESSRGPSRSGLRRALVGTQFFIAITLMVLTLTVLKQVRFSESKDLGYDTKNLIILRNPDARHLKNAEIVKRQVLLRSGVTAAASLESFPSSQNRNISTIHTESNRQEEGVICQSLDVDEDFVPTLGLSLVSGRNFEPRRSDDTQSVLINQTAARELGFDSALGEYLFRGDSAYRIIGILEDWHTNSIHSRIFPTVVFRSQEDATSLVVRLPEGDRAQEVIGGIRAIWSEILPNQIFDYVFVEDLQHWSYGEERRLASLLISFCQLTVFVACLGIFGLAAYSAEQRTKEIGIRKVLGSGVSSIVLLLSRSYLRWVLVAAVIAWPAGYIVVNWWLQSFAYRTPIGPLPFLLAGLLALAVALVSVIFTTLKAAVADPVDSLRYE